MCCSPCFRGYACMGWMVSGIVTSFIVILLFGALEGVLGGPFPTYPMVIGSVLLYVSCVLNIIVSIAGLILIIRYTEPLSRTTIAVQWSVFSVANVFFVYNFCACCFSIAAVAKPITQADMALYGTDYQKSYKVMPPGLIGLQTYSSLLVISGVPLGCCGANDFNDYIDPSLRTKECPENKKAEPMLEFTSEISCCKKGDKISDSDCQNPDYFKKNKYIAYDGQLYVHKLFVKTAGEAKTWDEVVNLAQNIGKDFSDWISTGPAAATAGDEEKLPQPNGDVDFTPRRDCNSSVKAYYLSTIGDWDNKVIWEDDTLPCPESETKQCAAERYLKGVKYDVKTSVLGCGELMELVMGDNNFVAIVLEQFNIPAAKAIVTVIRAIYILFISLVVLNTLLSLLAFNYYYVPQVLFPGRWTSLPFYPKLNKIGAVVTEFIGGEAPVPELSEKASTSEPTPAEEAAEEG